jgi:hypothetical protein
MMLHDYEAFTSPARREDGVMVRPRRAFDAWGTEYFVLPRNADSRDSNRSTEGLRRNWAEPRWSPEDPQGTPSGTALESIALLAAPWPDAWQQELQVVRNDAALPRAWIVHHWLPMAPLDPQNRHQVPAMLQPIVFPLRETAMVEGEALARDGPFGSLVPEGQPPAGESCRIVHYDPQRVEIDATLTAPGLIVLSDVYYPGWQLDVHSAGSSQPIAILRTNRLMRGALLPAGKHRLVYRYRPGSFHVGLAVSAATWLAGLSLLVIGGIRHRRHRTALNL